MQYETACFANFGIVPPVRRPETLLYVLVIWICAGRCCGDAAKNFHDVGPLYLWHSSVVSMSGEHKTSVLLAP